MSSPQPQPNRRRRQVILDLILLWTCAMLLGGAFGWMAAIRYGTARCDAILNEALR